jgi:hypothetical protein
MNRSDGRFIAQDNGDAGLQAGIGRIADAKAGDIGEKILHARSLKQFAN